MDKDIRATWEQAQAKAFLINNKSPCGEQVLESNLIAMEHILKLRAR